MTENPCYCPVPKFEEEDLKCKMCGGILRAEPKVAEKKVVKKKNNV